MAIHPNAWSLFKDLKKMSEKGEDNAELKFLGSHAVQMLGSLLSLTAMDKAASSVFEADRTSLKNFRRSCGRRLVGVYK